MQERTKRKKIGDALMKVALGCRVEEVTEEYAEVDGELRLTKRRETKKDIPPDLKAVQLLMASPEEGASDCSALSDEQLEAEKRRLLGLLQGAEEGAGKEENKGAGLRRKAIPEGTGETEEGGVKAGASARSAASKKSAGAAKSAGRAAKAGAGGESGTEAKPRRRAAKRRRRTKQ
ncbi:MAG TPA: hypothetical protein IAB32_08780 [Candidatus Scatosoma pullicola]|nr:hypothetical protein [Candidatus Scatosoma pullicola]